MEILNEIIGKKLLIVNYLKTIEGYDDYSNDPKCDFDYLPIGGLHFKLDDGNSYCTADYNTTQLSTSGVGIKLIAETQTDLTYNQPSDSISEKWKDKLGMRIKLCRVYWSKEDWTNHDKSVLYPESLEIAFENNCSIFYFSGEVDEYNKKEGRFNLIGGRNAGIVFFTRESFIKYKLNKVNKIETVELN